MQWPEQSRAREYLPESTTLRYAARNGCPVSAWEISVGTVPLDSQWSRPRPQQRALQPLAPNARERRPATRSNANRAQYASMRGDAHMRSDARNDDAIYVGVDAAALAADLRARPRLRSHCCC